MNLITYKSELEKQIDCYKNFVPLTKDYDSMFKLMREIHRLALLVNKIKEMNFDHLTSELNAQIMNRGSIINFTKNGI